MVTETKPLDPRADNQRERARNLDELSAQLKQMGGVDDDIADLLANNWQRFVGAIALLLLGVWLYGGYKSTKDQRAMESADRFQTIQGAYASLPTKPEVEKPASVQTGDDKTETEKTEAEKIEPAVAGEKPADAAEEAAKEKEAAVQSFKKEAELLQSSSSGTTYAKLSNLYDASQAMRVGNYAEAEKMLAAFDVAQLAKAKPANSKGEPNPENFVKELAGMLHARAKLVQDPAANGTAVREYLSGLASNAQFVNVEALILLGRIADTDEEKKNVRVLGESVATARPELRESIQTELATIGLSLS